VSSPGGISCLHKILITIIGAKLCIDLCDKIYTETSNGTDRLASEWWFNETDIEPNYKLVSPQGLLPWSTGTYVKIINLPAPSLNAEMITKLIIENYQYSIEPYGNVSIFLNDNKILSPRPTSSPYSFQKTVHTKKKPGKILHISGKFFFVDDEYIENIKKIGGIYTPGINIVVYGKTIVKGEFFDLLRQIKPGHSTYITGFIRCDDLIEIIKTSKDDFNRKNDIWWKYFIPNASKIFENWLKEINEWYELPREEDLYLTNIIKEIEKNLNTLMNNFPELIKNLLFSSKNKKPTPIVNDEGEQKGGEIDIDQLTEKKFDENFTSPKEKLEIDKDEKIGILNDIKDKKVTNTQKRVRGPKIIPLKDENRKEEIWFDPSTGAFIINTAHPAFIIASRNVEALDTHVTYIVFSYLLDLQDEISEEEKKTYLWKIYSTYLSQLR